MRLSPALVPLAATFLALPVNAQSFGDDASFKPARTFIGGSFVVAQPQQEFADYVNTSFGGSVNVVWQPLTSTPFLGLKFEGGMVGYGNEHKRVPFSETVGGRVMLDMTTSNLIGFLHAGPQLMRSSGLLRPYISPSIGLTYIATVTSLKGDDSEAFASDTNYDDLNFSYGATGGLYVPIKSGRTPISLDLGLRYHRNGVASYLVEGSIQDNPDGTISYDPIRSRADMVTFQLGVSVGLTKCSQARCGGEDD